MTSAATASAILIVEDDEALGGLLARHLEAHGFRVTEAPSAEVAADRLASGQRADLILLDINLPGMTGWDLLRDPRYGDAGRPPALVISAMTVPPERLRELGVAGYLPKPFPLETLVSTIGRLVARKEETRP